MRILDTTRTDHYYRPVQRGWVNAFRTASIQNKLNELDGWIRNRLRYCVWFRFIGRAVHERVDVRQLTDKALPMAIGIGTTITVERLKKRGYVPLLELYNQSKPVNWDGTMSLGFLMT